MVKSEPMKWCTKSRPNVYKTAVSLTMTMLAMPEMRMRKCMHNKLLCECDHEYCKREWSRLCVAYNQQFNGSKDWKQKFTDGQHADLHCLLESLNALTSYTIGSPRRPPLEVSNSLALPENNATLGIVHDAEGIWNHIALVRRIHINVKAYSFVSLYETRDLIGEWETDIAPTDSLCDVLDNERNFKRYISITAVCPGVRNLDRDLTSITYPEIKSIIDSWGQSLFLTPNVGIPQIHVVMRK